MKEPEEKRKTEQEEKIRELEEKIKKLEEAKEKDSEGVAGSVLKGISDIVPGLGDLIKSVGKSEAFKERLEEIDKEVERRLREAPLKKVEGRRAPIRTSFSQAPLVKDKPFYKPRSPAKGGIIRGKQRMKEPPTPKPREPLVDVFDEKEHLRLIAELPGVEEKDIKIDLKDDKLTLSADTAAHKYHQQVTLPCSPKGKPEKVFRNGILEIQIQKTVN